jgi:hypothetical protein
MDSKDMASQIADHLLDVEEHLKAWKSLATQGLHQPIEALESSVERRLGQIRSRPKYGESHAQFLKALRNASDDGALVTTLYEGIFRQSTAGDFHSDS